MSCVEDLDARPFVSPDLARSLLTVRAAISLARFVERPSFFSDSLTCSYWRSRFALHACRGISNPFPGLRGSDTRFRVGYSRGGFWTSCSSAYSSTSLITTSRTHPWSNPRESGYRTREVQERGWKCLGKH